MLRHDSFISLGLNIRLVGVTIHCYKAEPINCVVTYQCLLAMADNNKRLPEESNFENRNSHDLVNLVTSSETSLRQSENPNHPSNNSQGDPSLLKKKPTSFQITSVTVQGSRLSTDGGDDSADDLDESHTEDLSSDVLDLSRTTDIDNDPLSEESSNNAIIDAQKSISMKKPPEGQQLNLQVSTTETSIPPQSSVPLSIAPTATIPTTPNVSSNVKSTEPVTETEPKSSASVIPNQWQHRFRVVKIVSSQPFRRGRWLCMDFMDPPTGPATSEAKLEVMSETVTNVSAGSGAQAETVVGSTQTSNNVAHVYEIPPNESYPGSISLTVCPQPIQQPFYGIFLPLNNSQMMPDMSTMPYGFAQDSFKKAESNVPSMQPMTLGFVNQSSQVMQMPTTMQQPQSYMGSGNNSYDDSSVQSQGYISQLQQPATHSQSFASQPMQQQQQQQPVVQSQSFTTPSQQQQQPMPQATQSQSYTQQMSQPSSATASMQSMQAQSISQGGSQTAVHSMADSSSVQLAQSQAVNVVSAVNLTPKESPDQIMPPQQTMSNFPTTALSSQNLQHMSATPDISMTSQQTSNVNVAMSSSNASNIAPPNIPSNIPDNIVSSNIHQTVNKDTVQSVPSQVPYNHIDAGDNLTSNVSQPMTESLPEVPTSKPAEEIESAPSSSNTVAIDNKIEQAMDLVKSHLMFAVREEVDVLKEKITELVERISLLEYENTFLKANASQETLNQLNQSQQLQQQQQQQQTQNIIASSQSQIQQNIQSQQQPL